MIKPQDIEQKVFKISFKGYNVDEVDDFLQEICDSYVDLYIENKKYKEDNARLSEAVGQYKSMEGTLQDALSVADKSSNEIEQEAYRKAGEIVRNAEVAAKNIISKAKKKAELEEENLKNIQYKIERYKDNIKELLNAQMSILNGYPSTVTVSADVKEDDVHTEKIDVAETVEEITQIDEAAVIEEAAEVEEGAENDENAEIEEITKVNKIDIKEETEEISDDSSREFAVEQKTDLIEIVSMKTEDLPTVRMNENGEYVTE